MRYKARYPTVDSLTSLADYLSNEFIRIEAALDALFNGELEPAREFPPRQEPVLKFGDDDFDLGDGAGLYLRIQGQWYKLSMTPVGAVYPTTGSVNVVGQTPTVT